MKSKPTIPAPQNIKRREAYLLINRDTLPKSYVQAQLLKIARIRCDKKLRWAPPDTRLKTQDERMEETKQTFEPVKKEGIVSRLKNIFKRGK